VSFRFIAFPSRDRFVSAACTGSAAKRSHAVPRQDVSLRPVDARWRLNNLARRGLMGFQTDCAVGDSMMSTSAAVNNPLELAAADAILWLEPDQRYAVGSAAGKLVCRDSAGKTLIELGSIDERTPHFRSVEWHRIG
jgi:hypothetical protein